MLRSKLPLCAPARRLAPPARCSSTLSCQPLSSKSLAAIPKRLPLSQSSPAPISGPCLDRKFQAAAAKPSQQSPAASQPLAELDREDAFINVDGNAAAARVVYSICDTSFIYPITPSTPAGQLLDELAASGERNVWGEIVQVTEMESEMGVAGAVHGAAVGGALVGTFTSSQGLLLMIPNMYKMAGEALPIVIHCAARVVGTHGVSIYADHSDVAAVRSTGFCFLSSHSVQEAQDFAYIAHHAALLTSIPFLHFYEGMQISHEYTKIATLTKQEIMQLLPQEAIAKYHRRGINPARPFLVGTVEPKETIYQLTEASAPRYKAAAALILQSMEAFEKVTGRKYRPFQYSGHPEAENVVVIMGCGSQIAEEYVRSVPNEKIGLLKVHMWRPWSTEYFLDAFPKTVKRICVMDRVREVATPFDPLHTDVLTSLAEAKRDVFCVGGRYAIGDKLFLPMMVKAIYANLAATNPRNHFNVGIVDDVLGSSLEIGPDATKCFLPKGTDQCIFWGMGADGTVGSIKEAVKMIGDHSPLFAQGIFNYDAHKSGGVTVSHLRVAPEPLGAHYPIMQADYVAVHQETYLKIFEVAKELKEGGIFVLNTRYTGQTLFDYLPVPTKKLLGTRRAEVYTIHAGKVAKETGMGKYINNIMQVVFLTLFRDRSSSPALLEELLTVMKKSVAKTYAKKGPAVIEKNLQAIDAAAKAIVKENIPWDEWARLDCSDTVADIDWRWTKAPDDIQRVTGSLAHMKADDLPVSAFLPHADGRMPMGSLHFEKRGIAPMVPEWIAEKCSQCNYCSFVCPHSAIRPSLNSQPELVGAPASFQTLEAKGEGKKGMRFRVQVSPMDCTGCTTCINVCPDQALVAQDTHQMIEKETANWEYAQKLPEHADSFDRSTVKGSQFKQPYLEFAPTCDGCPQSAYVKVLTQLFGERMNLANGVGCTTVWGGTFGFNPYRVDAEGRGPPWANSLFEDNAQFGLGIHTATQGRRKTLQTLIGQVVLQLEEDPVLKTLPAELKSAFDEWNELCETAVDVSEKTYQLAKKILPQFVDKHPLLKAIYTHVDYFPKLSQWILGGDGWAYDIGFGGLDHVLASGSNVNILVLDNEVYGNTGGQRSKATPMGAITKFATAGKDTNKKDLGLIAMTYGSVYVASVNYGASMTQLVNAFVEAERYPGPSLIIAYSPCIEHGIEGGLGHSVEQMRLATESGYWPLYRYNPLLKQMGQNPFLLDSPRIKLDLEKFLARENRFVQLARSNPEKAKAIWHTLTQWTKERHRRLHALASAHADSSGEARAQTDSGESLLILYGSETGNSEGLALETAKACAQRQVNVQCMEADAFDMDQLPDQKRILFITATSGAGEFPANIKDTWKFLSNPTLPANYLSGVKFAVFGLGDSGYGANFCRAAIALEARLLELGGERIVPRGVGDDQEPGQYEHGWEAWQPQVWEKWAPTPKAKDGSPETLKFAQGHLVIAEDADRYLNYEVTSEPLSSPVKPHWTKWKPKGAHYYKVLKSELLTPPETTGQRDSGSREVYNIDLELEKGAEYHVGDVLHVYGENDVDAVDEFLGSYGVHPALVLRIHPKLWAPKVASLPAITTARSLFAQVLDLFGRPPHSFYRSLAHFAPDAETAEKVLNAPKAMADLCPTYADVLRAFPQCKPPLDHLISLIRPIRTRAYSIASAPEPSGGALMSLTIATHTWKTPVGQNRRGHCSYYLNHLLKPGHVLSAGVKSSGLIPPTDQKIPLILVAIGTGIAPFRGFLQHRIDAAKRGPVGSIRLFFGCRHEKTEFLHGPEWRQIERDQPVPFKLIPAFSRDQAERIRVPRRIREDGKAIADLLLNQGAYFYMCGPAGRVPVDVRAAIVESLVTYGGMTEKAADDYISVLVVQGKFNVEGWGTVE